MQTIYFPEHTITVEHHPYRASGLVPGLLPAGFRLDDALTIVSDAFAASTTAAIGFQYADYFFAALDTATAGRTRANNAAVRPVTLPKDAYLILTRGGAADSAAGILDVIVEGVLMGAS